MLNKFLLKGKEVIERVQGKKGGGKGRRTPRKDASESRTGGLGSHLFPVYDTWQVSRLHLVGPTASEALLCML